MAPILVKAVNEISKKRHVGLRFIYFGLTLVLICVAMGLIMVAGSMSGPENTLDPKLQYLFTIIFVAIVYLLPITLGIGISILIETNRTTVMKDGVQQKTQSIPLSSRVAVSTATIATAAVMLIPTDDQLANQLKPIALIFSLIVIVFVVFVPHNRK